METRIIWNRETIVILIESGETTLGEFKLKVYQHTGVQPEHQTLKGSFEIGNDADDSHTFQDLGIFDPSIPVEFRLLGETEEQIAQRKKATENGEQIENNLSSLGTTDTTITSTINPTTLTTTNTTDNTTTIQSSSHYNHHGIHNNQTHVGHMMRNYFQQQQQNGMNDSDYFESTYTPMEDDDFSRSAGPEQATIIRLLDELGTNSSDDALSNEIISSGVELCQGTFNEAVAYARKNHLLLVVLLYHPADEISQIFVYEAFTNQLVRETMMRRCVLWYRPAPPQNDPEKASRWIETAASVLYLEKQPYIGICLCNGSQINLVDVIQSEEVTVDGFVVRLVTATEVHGTTLDEAMAKATDESSASKLRTEQDEAYQMALLEQQSREAEEELKRQEEEKQKLFEEEKRKTEEIQEVKRKAEIEVQREAKRKQFMTEPDPSIGKVTRLKIRTPEGESILKAFYSNQTLHDVADYLFSRGVDTKNLVFLQTHPNKQFADLSVTLDSAGFGNSANLLSERKAL